MWCYFVASAQILIAVDVLSGFQCNMATVNTNEKRDLVSVQERQQT